MKVRVDGAACVGHGRCYVLAPEVYEDDERGRCVVVAPDVPPELEAKARLGAENCPEQAIEVED
ncbi:MAG TPA: ferredoxin [Myxococcota bacterium]|nr:ferredoxin [Myxococcota bacterium]